MRIILTITFLLIIISANAQYNVTTYAGGHAGFVNGKIDTALFNQPFGICRDKQGDIYVSDANNNCIRKIDVSGNVSTYAGQQSFGLVNAQGTGAKFNSPVGLCADEAGNIYVADFGNQCIRKIDVNRNVTTIAGSGIEGLKDGDSSTAKFDYPRGIAMDKAGNLYVADSWNHRIRKIDALSHYVSTYAGGGDTTGVQSTGNYRDDTASSARFYTPSGLCIDPDGNLYVADAYNNRIRMIDVTRRVTTIAGSGPTGPSTGGFADSTRLLSLFNIPTDLFYAGNGTLLISDTYNNRVRMLSNGQVSTIAGNGMAAYKEGNGQQAEFNAPRGIMANASADSIWVIDYNNSAIRLITLNNTFAVTINPTFLHIFPNPANDKIRIQFPDDGTNTSIQIINCLGKIVLAKQSIDEPNSAIDISQLTTGIYFITMDKGTERTTVKWVKD